MGRVFIVLSTILVLAIIGVRNSRTNSRLIVSFLDLVKEINKTYISLFRDRRIISRIINTIMIVGAGVLSFGSIYNSVMSFMTLHSNVVIDLAGKVLVIVFCIVVIHFSIGYVLLITTKINKFFHKVEDNNTKTNLILSYFIISTYFAVLVMFPQQFGKDYLIGLMGIATSYLLNLKVLINLIKDPANIKSKNNDEESFTKIITASILIVVMILLNLFLGVCIINGNNPGAFSSNPSSFDLFYYTIITFTTIGYGDITPLSISAKVIAMVISVTSVICITIFLSTVLSYRDKV